MMMCRTQIGCSASLGANINPWSLKSFAVGVELVVEIAEFEI
jgi:hypothetical protein